MNITLYLDVYPGMTEDMAIATPTPGVPIANTNTTRYRIDIEIDDPNGPVQIPKRVDVMKEERPVSLVRGLPTKS